MPERAFLREGKKITRIEEVIIENFQSHKYTTITLSDGLNVIIGASDHGKSAIIRAIKWVLYNEPRGSDYIRQGAKYAKVTLKMSNGYIITRERSASKNRYILKDKEGNASIFEGFGSEVPYEVVKAHGIPKVILDTDKKTCLNIGEQLEGPFLISESGALRAKAIGRMIGLHILDKSIKDSATDLRRENQTKDRLNTELEDIDTKLLEFKDLNKLKEKLDESENIIQKLENSTSRIEKLENKRLQLEDIKDRELKTNEILLKLNRIMDGEMILKTIELDIEKLNRLLNIQKRYLEVKDHIYDTNILLTKTEDINKGIEIINTVNEKAFKYEKIKGYKINLDSIQKRIANKKDILKETDNTEKGIEFVNSINIRILRYDKVKKHQMNLDNINKEIVNKEEILNKTKDIYDVENIVKKIYDDSLNINMLKLYKNKYNICKKEMSNVEKQIKECDNVNEAESIIIKIDEMLKIKKKLTDLNEMHKENRDRIKEGLTYIDKKKIEMEKLLNEYVKILKDSGKCPLCDSLIGQNMIENIIANYREENK